MEAAGTFADVATGTPVGAGLCAAAATRAATVETHY